MRISLLLTVFGVWCWSAGLCTARVPAVPSASAAQGSAPDNLQDRLQLLMQETQDSMEQLRGEQGDRNRRSVDEDEPHDEEDDVDLEGVRERRSIDDEEESQDDADDYGIAAPRMRRSTADDLMEDDADDVQDEVGDEDVDGVRARRSVAEHDTDDDGEDVDYDAVEAVRERRSADSGDLQTAASHYEKGGGAKHKESHFAKKGKKGDKGHKEKKYWDAAEAGKHGKKHKESHYAKKGAHKKKHHDEAKKYGKKHSTESGHKGEKFHHKKGHKKGSKVKGESNNVFNLTNQTVLTWAFCP